MWKQKILPDWIWLLFCRLRLLSCIFCNIRLYVNLIVRHVLLLKLPLFDEWQAASQQQKVEKSRRRRSYSIYQRGYIHVSFPMYKSCLRDRAEHLGIARVLVFISSSMRCTLWGTAVRADDARVAELLTLCSSASSEISHQRAPSISAGFTMLML